MTDEIRMIRSAKLWARFHALPAALTAAVDAKLAEEVAALVVAQKAAAPVSGLEGHSGHFRNSIHAIKSPQKPLTYIVLATAKDKKGRFIGSHIEQGHIAPNGRHVPAKPSFFPTYRQRKKGIRRRLTQVVKKTLRTLFPR